MLSSQKYNEGDLVLVRDCINPENGLRKSCSQYTMPYPDLIGSIQEITLLDEYYNHEEYFYVVNGVDENGNDNRFYLREQDIEVVFTK